MDNTAEKIIDMDQYRDDGEVETASDDSGMSPVLAGFLGGFVAYGVIAAAGKLKKIISDARARKNEEDVKTARRDTAVEDQTMDEDSDE